MKLLTWNIQWGLGMDGRMDLTRIVRTAREMLRRKRSSSSVAMSGPCTTSPG